MPGLAQFRSAEAALRRFPNHRLKIGLLLLSDSNFRDMCEELVVAERALLEAEKMLTPVRQERIADWSASIDRLTADMARALAGTK